MSGGPAGGPRTIEGLSEAYRDGNTSPIEATQGMLARIEKLNPKVNYFITVLAASALESARRSELRLKEGSSLGPLDGVPIAVKDIIYIEGVRCTAGSKILADNVAGYDSEAVRRLKAAGAVLIGTTNLHEFAAGVTSVNPYYGPVRNPWNTEHVAGGSSGGSAAAVSSGLASGALGTDTAGSVRIPAALCGVFGLKPTYGLVSRLGVIPLSSSLDTVGTLTSTTWDAAAMLQVLAGHREGDSTTADVQSPDYLGELAKPFTGARVGVPRKYFLDVLGEEVQRAFENFLERLRGIGCVVEDVVVDGIEEAYGRWLPIRRAEATAFHLKWLETLPDLYGEDVRNLLELGKDVSAVEYVSAMTARPSLTQRFAASMKDFAVLAAPTTCVAAPLIGQQRVPLGGRDVEVYSALNRLTLPFNYVGFPAISVPAGDARGLPVGAQIIGKAFDESGVLRVAQAYESAFGPFPSPPLG